MSKRLSITVSEEVYEKIRESANDVSPNKHAARLLETLLKAREGQENNVSETDSKEIMREDIENTISRILDPILAEKIKSNLKDQTLVELETAERIAERSIKWAKILGVFVALPLGLFAALLSFIGISTWNDLSKVDENLSKADAKVTEAREKAELATKISDELMPELENVRLIVDSAKQLESEVAELQVNMSSLGSQVGEIANRQAELEKKVSQTDILNNLYKALAKIRFGKDTEWKKVSLGQRLDRYFPGGEGSRIAFASIINNSEPLKSHKVLIHPNEFRNAGTVGDLYIVILNAYKDSGATIEQ